MQKKLIALAIAGLSSAAFAQSNVTVYGVADLTFDNVKASGASGGAANYDRRNRVSSNSSHIGFKGSEALGNGMTAVFQIENGLQLDNATAGVWNNRDSFVGLSGGFGTVLAGNLTGPTRAMGAKMDVNAGATGIGANTALLAKLGGGSGAGAFDQRITNAIAYVTPTMSGFTGVIGYSAGLVNLLNGAALAGREVAGAGNTAQGNTAWTAGLAYDNGPIYAGYAYTAVKASNNGAAAADGLAALGSKLADHRAAVKYSAGAFTVGLMFDRAELTQVAGGKIKQTTWYVPATFAVTASGKVIAQYGQAKDMTGTPGLNDTGAKHFALGYEHSLSKRTMVKAMYSQITNKANADYDYLYGVTGANTTATAGTLNAGADPKGFSVGIRHTF